MKQLFTFVLAILANCVFAQAFEGKIIYQNTAETTLPSFTTESLTKVMGSEQVYIIKKGNYKSISNGFTFEWQMYRQNENKVYTKSYESGEIIWIDGARKDAEILGVKINKGVTKILGYTCDEAIFTTTDGTETYYYSTEPSVDISLYSKHAYGNWYEYLKIARALPLKSVVENEKFKFTSIAIEIKAIPISDKEFDMPKDVVMREANL